MKHQIERHHRLILPAIYLASLLLPLIAPVSSTAQTELRGAWRSTVSHLPITSFERLPGTSTLWAPSAVHSEARLG